MRIPVLMYHKVGATLDGEPDRFLNVARDDFAAQMRILKKLGFQAVTFQQAAEGLFRQGVLPRKPVCVTFDDAYTCVGEFAGPVLDSNRWPATLFVPTQYVGGQNDWDVPNRHPILPIMDWAALRKWSDNGWEIAGHTRSHPKLGELPDDEAFQEIDQGAQDIRENIGINPTTFCYPYGHMNARTLDLVKRAEFLAACTTKSGLASSNQDRCLLPRVKIAYSDGVAGMLYRIYVRPVFGRSKK